MRNEHKDLIPRLKVASLAQNQSSTTCSAIVVRRLGFLLVPANSFEEAVDLCKNGSADAVLIPGAYPDIRHFYMDPALHLSELYREDIPALVYASKQDGELPYDVVHCHPATSPFWWQLAGTVVEATSNDTAADAVCGAHDACITNEAAAARAGLKVLRVFRKASPMAWNLFVPAT